MSNSSLQDKIVLITGAASGIGEATAKYFADKGARIALVDINTGGATQTLKSLSDPSKHIVVTCDLSDSTQCKSTVESVVNWAGTVHILINAAAYLKRKAISQVDDAFMDQTMAINMKGPLFLAQACAEPMLKQKFGRIILFSSQGAFTGGFNGSAVYAMTKAAVLALAKSLAREYAQSGITVNCIAPGGVDTPMLHSGMSETELSEFIAKIPLGRLATAKEIAQACAFLSSDSADYITGTTLDVNGGQLMR
ncbi:MAG: SDR family oxidoreductase [Kangiellaceae bacterium]|nr:SDR family oxidoreductase [Kangiellaceae bacterium]